MANNQTISAIPVPLNPEMKGKFHNLIHSESYDILKSLIVASAIRVQVEAMNISLYSGNPEADFQASTLRERAAFYQSMLDELGKLEVDEENWALVRLEPSQ